MLFTGAGGDPAVAFYNDPSYCLFKDETISDYSGDDAASVALIKAPLPTYTCPDYDMQTVLDPSGQEYVLGCG